MLKTEPFMEQLDELPLETAIKLYNNLESFACLATAKISMIDAELRVEACDRQDRVLERIVDLAPTRRPSTDALNIFTPAVQSYRRWANMELMKDKCLTGYNTGKRTRRPPCYVFWD